MGDAFVAEQLQAGAQVALKLQVANRHAVDPTATPGSARRPAAKPSTCRAPGKQVDTGGRRQPGSYHPAWVRAQVMLRLRLLGWLTGSGQVMNPVTGEIFPPEVSTVALINLMVGGSVGVERRDPLLE